jgi:hypothetical protein
LNLILEHDLYPDLKLQEKRTTEKNSDDRMKRKEERR